MISIPGYYSRYPQEYKGKLSPGIKRDGLCTMETNEGTLYYKLQQRDNQRIVYIYSSNILTQEEKDKHSENRSKARANSIQVKKSGNKTNKELRREAKKPKSSYTAFKQRIQRGLSIEVAVLTTEQYSTRKMMHD